MTLVDLGTAVVGAVVFAGLVVSFIEIERHKHRAGVYKHLLKQYTIHTAFSAEGRRGDVEITANLTDEGGVEKVYTISLIRKDGFKELLGFPVVQVVKALLMEEVNVRGDKRMSGKLKYIRYYEGPINP